MMIKEIMEYSSLRRKRGIPEDDEDWTTTPPPLGTFPARFPFPFPFVVRERIERGI